MTVQPLGGWGWWWWWWRVKEEGEEALNYNIQISTELSAITGTAYVSGDGGRQPRPLTGAVWRRFKLFRRRLLDSLGWYS